MPEIPEIGVRSVSVPEIPAWRSMPPQSIPEAPPVTLQLGFPIAEMPGCVETRNTQPGNENVYDSDPKGNFVVCDGTLPSYRPLDFTPGAMTYGSAKPPAVDVPEEKEPTDHNSKKDQSAKPTPPAEQLADFSTIAAEIPCPPPDAIPIGAKNKSQTAIVVGYQLVDGKCETQYEMLDVPTIVGNYLPGAPVVMTTATIAAMATTAAIFAKPLGDFLLKAVKPTVKKTIKKINAMRGKKPQIESVFQRRQFQRSLRK